MLFFFLIIWLTFGENFVKFGNAEKTESALVIVRTSDYKLEFPPVKTTLSSDFVKYELTSTRKYFILLCHDKYPDALNIESKIQNTNNCDPRNKCYYPAEPTLFRVKKGLKNDDGQKRVHLYHIGFTVADDDLSNIVEITEYDSLINKNYRFMPMVSVYRDTELHFTLAVDYKIIKVDQKKILEDIFSTFYSSHHFIEKIEQFYQNQKSKLKDLLGEIIYDENIHVLKLDSLMNENNFKVDTWKKTARYKVHQILIWKENIEIWRDVQEMVRNIADTSSYHTNVTAGPGKALTIKGSEGQEYKMQWGEEKDTIFIPELYWIAIKFKSKNVTSNKTTGMLVIMKNEPIAEKNDVEPICDRNFCEDRQVWVKGDRYDKLKERVYCCPMNSETIQKLGVAFLLKPLEFIEVSRILFPPYFH